MTRDRLENLLRDLFTAYGWQAGVTVLIVVVVLLLVANYAGVDLLSWLGM